MSFFKMQNRTGGAGARAVLLPALVLALAALLLALAEAGNRPQPAPAAVPAEVFEFKITENNGGSCGPLDYTFWMDSGTGEMVVRSDGSFSCCWEQVGNALFRDGLRFYQKTPPEELGEIRIRYEADYAPQGKSFLCAYGWMEAPLVEYYIVENWSGERPGESEPIGTVRTDGGEYDIYYTIRVNKPSIVGDTTFPQYWSVRREPRSGGEITVSAHFEAWKALGLELGSLREISTTVEAVESSGAADIPQNVILIEHLP